MIPLSTQAQMLVEKLKEFDYEKFTKWWLEKKAVAGTMHVIEFLDTEEKTEVFTEKVK